MPYLQRGGSPGEQGAGGVRETGEERAESGISTMAGSGIEIQKDKLSLFATAYIKSKKRTQQRFLTSANSTIMFQIILTHFCL